jgi:hypothetical protein
VLFNQFAICIILPSSIPNNTGIYAINQMAEYLNSNFDFSYIMLKNLIRTTDFLSKFNIKVPGLTNTKNLS